MSKVNFSPKQQKMLRQARKLIERESAGYIEILKQHIHALATALENKDLPLAIRICHQVQSQAGTFGWPLATEIAGWFKRLLGDQNTGAPDVETNALFLQSLNKIIRDDLKAESAAAVRLLQHIEGELKKQNIR